MQVSSYVLLDAMIIIEAHARGVWASLVNRVQLVVPSIVVQEARFYIDPSSGDELPIDLAPAVTAGKIQVVSASPAQIAALYAQLDDVFIQTIHAGEAEALALLFSGTLPDHLFCTAEAPATKALALLDMKDVGISFEDLLSGAGEHPKLLRHYTERFFREALTEGAKMRIQGVGLRQQPAQTRARGTKKKGAGKHKKTQ